LSGAVSNNVSCAENGQIISLGNSSNRIGRTNVTTESGRFPTMSANCALTPARSIRRRS
jgi:hypothetical protein